jgi:hypothetical protein
MATGGFDALSSNLKIVYPSKALEALVNEEAPFRGALKKKTPPGGRVSEGNLKFGAYLNPPQNVGQLADADNLPTPKDRTQIEFTLTPTLFAGTFQIGWVTKAAANSNKSAYNGGELRRRTEETASDLGKFIEQTYAGTHGTGRRATVEAATTASASFVAAEDLGVILLRENFKVSVRTADGGDTVRDSCDNITISSITRSTRTVTLATGTYTLSAGDSVHVVSKGSQTGLSSLSAMGLPGIVDDGTLVGGTFQGIATARTTYPKLKCIVKDNGGSDRDISEQILVNAVHEVRHISGKRVTDMWSNTGQAEKYIEFVAPDRRYAMPPGGGTTKLSTGYQEGDLVHYAPGVAFKLNISVDMHPGRIYLLCWDTFFHYQAQEMAWWDEGSMLKPVPTDGGFKAAYFAAMAGIENIGCDMPGVNVLIKDLTDPLLS